MPSYEYKAITPQGRVIIEALDAPNEQSVSREILKKGYRPVAIKKSKAAKPASGKSDGDLFKKKIKTEEIVLFTRELVTLLRAGVPMLTALEALGSQSGKALGDIVNQIYVSVMSGKSFSQALGQHPKVFSKLYVNSVYAGEMSGSLDEVLERMVAVLKNDEDMKKKVKSAMRYPIFVIAAMIGAFIIIMTAVVPKFAQIFSGLGAELPIFTKILLALSQVCEKYVLHFLVAGVVGFIGFKFLLKNPKGRLWWDGFILKIPLIGQLTLKTAMARFTKMFETLNKSGLPILQTLNTVSGAVGNIAIEKTIKQVANGVEQGQGIAGAMKKSNLFPPMVIRMISIGEQSGSLDEMLGSVASHYDVEVEYAIKGLTSMIEPILTLALGGAVVVMAFGIFLPMWGLVGAMT
jgi:type II secretory pathway component PulF